MFCYALLSVFNFSFCYNIYFMNYEIHFVELNYIIQKEPSVCFYTF